MPDACLEEFIEMGQSVTGPPHGDGTRRGNFDQSGLAPAIGHKASEVAGVDRRVGVGHRHHGGVATGGGSSCS